MLSNKKHNRIHHGKYMSLGTCNVISPFTAKFEFNQRTKTT